MSFKFCELYVLPLNLFNLMNLVLFRKSLFLVEGTAAMKGSVISHVTMDIVYLFHIVHYVLIIDLKITRMSLKKKIKRWTLKT